MSDPDIAIRDLDEVDIALLSLIAYLRRHGIGLAQVAELLAERVDECLALSESITPPTVVVH